MYQIPGYILSLLSKQAFNSYQQLLLSLLRNVFLHHPKFTPNSQTMTELTLMCL